MRHPKESHSQNKELIFGTIMFVQLNLQQLPNYLKHHISLIRLHFLAVINSSRLSWWSSALNTDSMDLSFLLILFHLSCERGHSYIV